MSISYLFYRKLPLNPSEPVKLDCWSSGDETIWDMRDLWLLSDNDSFCSAAVARPVDIWASEMIRVSLWLLYTTPAGACPSSHELKFNIQFCQFSYLGNATTKNSRAADSIGLFGTKDLKSQHVAAIAEQIKTLSKVFVFTWPFQLDAESFLLSVNEKEAVGTQTVQWVWLPLSSLLVFVRLASKWRDLGTGPLPSPATQNYCFLSHI